MKTAYTHESTISSAPKNDNGGLILGVGLILMMLVLGGMFFFFNYSESNRAIDAANADAVQSAAEMSAAQAAAAAAQSQAEPLIIDRPVVIEVEKPYIIEKEVIREVPATTPAPDDAAAN